MEEQIKKILYKVEPRLEKYTGENMVEDGILESIQIFDLINRLEEEYNIDITPEYIVPENFADVSTIIHMVEKVKNRS